MTPLSFDPEKPFLSIRQFTQIHEILPQDNQIEYIEDIEDYLMERAYNNHKPKPTDDLKIFRDYDAMVLCQVTEKITSLNRASQLLSNLVKITDLALNSMNYRLRLYPVTLQEDTSCWGWIHHRYVDSSKPLTEALQQGHVVLTGELATPLLLLALQRVQGHEVHSEANGLSFKAFIELILFAHHWDIPPLKSDLKTYYEHLKTDHADFEGKMRTQESNRMEKISNALKELESCSPSQNGPPSSPPAYPATTTECRWFNPNTPYNSIMTFTRQCSILTIKEQNLFFACVQNFFSLSAYHQQHSAIPATLEDPFALKAVPLLLHAIPCTESEQLQMLTAIQIVAEKSFPRLPPANQLVLIKLSSSPQRTQIGFISNMHVGNLPEPLRPSTNTPTAPLEFLSMSGPPLCFTNDCETTPKQVVSMLLLALKHSFSSWLGKALTDLNKLLETKETQTETSTFFIKGIDEKWLHELARSLPIELIKPDVNVLTKDEQCTLNRLADYSSRSVVT